MDAQNFDLSSYEHSVRPLRDNASRIRLIRGKDQFPDHKFLTKSKTFVEDWTKRNTFLLVNTFLVMSVYVLVGGAIFSALEHPEEEKTLEKQKEDIEDLMRSLTTDIVHQSIAQACNSNYDECMSNVDMNSLYNTSFHKVSN